MEGKHTNCDWELDMEGIIGEIKANGSLNDIDVNDDSYVANLAESVFNDAYYKDAVLELSHSDKKDDDKFEDYYSTLWDFIETNKY